MSGIFYICNSCGRETHSLDKLFVCPECASSDIDASRTEEVYDEHELEGEVMGDADLFLNSDEIEGAGDLDL